MIGILENIRQWICKDRQRLAKPNAMILEVVRGLLGVPFEFRVIRSF